MCWEHASQLRDEVFPALKKKNQKLFLVGVGTSEAAAEFASQLDIDPSICFGDDSGSAGDALGLGKGFKTMWNPPAVDNMMSRNDEQSLKKLGMAYKEAADNIGIKNLAPSDISDTLRQGATFVFRGDKTLLTHFDEKVGDNCDISDIFAAVSSR